MKICTKCNEDREFEDFNKAKKGKYGLRATCRDCDKEYNDKYTQEHKEQTSAYGKMYRERDGERISSQRAEHTAKNKERLAEYQKQWRKANPGKTNARTAKRRAAKLQATPKWVTKEQFKQMEAMYVEAARLTKETGIPHEVDHIRPLQGRNESGLHVPWNLQILTESENRKKSRKITT